MTASRDVDLVNITQKKWADMVLKIGNAYRKKINLDDLVSELLHKIYAFDHCSILFKPTLAKHNQFRTTKEEFISYFLGNYYFEDEKNEFLKVEYTFGFIKVSPDELRINLHHSSLPYND